MAVALALLASLGSGVGDFLGALASRRGRTHAVVAIGQVVGVFAAIALSPVIGGDPTSGDLWWGAAAGVSAALGILGLYQGLAVGDVGLVSPIAAVGAASWPVLYSLVIGDVPSGIQAVGLAVGVVAIWLVSQAQGNPRAHHAPVATAVWLGMAGGAGFGGMFIFFGEVGDDAGMWPLLPARSAGAIVLVSITLLAGRSLRPVAGTMWAVVAAGTVTVAGNGMFVLASHRGSLAVVSVLAAMFPATTVVLARIFWGERLGPGRVAGLALALAAVGLVVAG